LFIQLTVDPTEMVIAFGENPPLVIVAVTVVGVGDMGELLLVHAAAAAKTIAASTTFILTDMMNSFHNREGCKWSAPLTEERERRGLAGRRYGWLTKITRGDGGRKPSVSVSYERRSSIARSGRA
jgi:hypothetical protein